MKDNNPSVPDSLSRKPLDVQGISRRGFLGQLGGAAAVGGFALAGSPSTRVEPGVPAPGDGLPAGKRKGSPTR